MPYDPFFGVSITPEKLGELEKPYRSNPPRKDFPNDIATKLFIQDEITLDACKFLWRVLRERVGNSGVVVGPESRNQIYALLEEDYGYVFERAPLTRDFVDEVINTRRELIGPDVQVQEQISQQHQENLERLIALLNRKVR